MFLPPYQASPSFKVTFLCPCRMFQCSLFLIETSVSNSFPWPPFQVGLLRPIHPAMLLVSYQESPSFSFPLFLPSLQCFLVPTVPPLSVRCPLVPTKPHQPLSVPRSLPRIPSIHFFLGPCQVFCVSWSLLFLPFQSGLLGHYKA